MARQEVLELRHVAAAFARAPVPLVARHLETLVMVGELRLVGDGRYAAVAEPL